MFEEVINNKAEEWSARNMLDQLLQQELGLLTELKIVENSPNSAEHVRYLKFEINKMKHKRKLLEQQLNQYEKNIINQIIYRMELIRGKYFKKELPLVKEFLNYYKIHLKNLVHLQEQIIQSDRETDRFLEKTAQLVNDVIPILVEKVENHLKCQCKNYQVPPKYLAWVAGGSEHEQLPI